jgi:hypothetical protein
MQNNDIHCLGLNECLTLGFGQFGLRGCKLIFQVFQFRRVVQLFLGPRDLPAEVLDPLIKGVDLLFDFFVHISAIIGSRQSDIGFRLTARNGKRFYSSFKFFIIHSISSFIA